MKPVERSFGYCDGAPVMVLRPARHDNKNRFIIKLDDLWKYSDTHNEQFDLFIANKVIQICMLFDIEIPMGEHGFTQLMATIAATIMDGIDDLVKMPPYREGHNDPDTVIDARTADETPNIKVGMMYG